MTIAGASRNFAVERAKNGWPLKVCLSASACLRDTTLHSFDCARLHLHVPFSLSNKRHCGCKWQRLHKAQIRGKNRRAEKKVPHSKRVRSYHSHSCKVQHCWVTAEKGHLSFHRVWRKCCVEEDLVGMLYRSKGYRIKHSPLDVPQLGGSYRLLVNFVIIIHFIQSCPFAFQ